MKIVRLSSLICALLLYPIAAAAWLRPQYEDATVVDRSELIVVAHIKPGSTEYVPHKKQPDEGASWEYHATLVVSEVLKGKCDDKEIPIRAPSRELESPCGAAVICLSAGRG